MRKHVFLTVVAFIFCLITAAQLVSSHAQSKPIHADVDIDPDTINLHSKGKFITVYIELPEGYNVADIVLETVYLENIRAITDSTYGFVSNPSSYLMDHDGDGILERMVKFSRADTISLLMPHMSICVYETTLVVTGRLSDGTNFQGSVTIKVICVR